jgi:glycosyltransferase involved in cell wall biosynthesis
MALGRVLLPKWLDKGGSAPAFEDMKVADTSAPNSATNRATRLKLSVVICTKDRPDDLRQTLETLWPQSRLPDELVIIDDGHLEIEPIAAAARNYPIAFVYHNKSDKPGLARSRRTGIEKSSGDVILFLDDDVLLDRRHIEALMEVYELDTERRIGGCCGVADGFHYRPMQMLLLRFFGMDAPRREGRILKNFLGVLVRNARQPVDVQWLSGSDMSYRREAIVGVEIPPEIEDCTFSEDRTISYQVGLRWRMIATPGARFIHRRAVSGRDPRIRGFEEIFYNHIAFRRFMPQDFSHRAAFAWMCVGYIVINLLRFDWRRAVGNLRAIGRILSGARSANR